ncbi:DUF1731 domain-containing protein, partial [Streptomyces sp. NPDC006386]
RTGAAQSDGRDTAGASRGRLLESGFRFAFPEIEGAIRAAL